MWSRRSGRSTLCWGMWTDNGRGNHRAVGNGTSEGADPRPRGAGPVLWVSRCAVRRSAARGGGVQRGDWKFGSKADPLHRRPEQRVDFAGARPEGGGVRGAGRGGLDADLDAKVVGFERSV